MTAKINSLLIAAFLFCSNAFAQITFTETTVSAGITTTGESWGISWGDLNGDHWPDFFLNNHWRITVERSNYPEFYINNQDGSFSRFSPPIFESDGHAAAFGDPDNDGDQDLLYVTGRGGANQLLVNVGDSLLIDKAEFVKLDAFKGRGRSPAWVDLNSDGKLDVVISYAAPLGPEQPYTSFYARHRNGFLNADSLVGFNNTRNCNLVTLADLNADQFTDLLLVFDKGLVMAYDYKGLPSLPIQDKTIAMMPDIVEVIPGDFNGDLRTDLYFIRNSALSNAYLADSFQIQANVIAETDEKGFRFSSSDSFSIDFVFNVKPNFPIYLGSDSLANDTLLHFDFPATAPTGSKAHIAGVDTGIYISYLPTENQWELLFSAPATTKGIAIEINGKDELGIASTFGFATPPVQRADFLLLATDTAFAEVIGGSGIPKRTGSYSGVAADFDNDRDLDIYLVCGSALPNITNVMLENNGGGNYTAVPLAGGAPGSTVGLGECVSFADYNKDGYLDLAVTNGNGDLYPGPVQLYKNMGAGRHFLSIQLEGTMSNRDGIGTVAHLYTGGMGQLREQNNGAHRYAQNENRLHFGLDTFQIVDSLLLFWPSGIIQKLYDLPADSFITIVETAVTAKASPLGSSFSASTQQTYIQRETVGVFPNPTANRLKLLTAMSGVNGKARIINSKGRLAAVLDCREGTIKTSSLPDGYYSGSLQLSDRLLVFSFAKF